MWEQNDLIYVKCPTQCLAFCKCSLNGINDGEDKDHDERWYWSCLLFPAGIICTQIASTALHKPYLCFSSQLRSGPQRSFPFPAPLKALVVPFFTLVAHFTQLYVIYPLLYLFVRVSALLTGQWAFNGQEPLKDRFYTWLEMCSCVTLDSYILSWSQIFMSTIYNGEDTNILTSILGGC